MIKVETISLVLLLILVTLLELLFQNSQMEYLIGIKFGYVVTLLFFFNQKYRLGIIYLIISSIFLELILFHTIGIAICIFSISVFIVNFVLTKFVNIKLEDSRYLISVLVLTISPFLAKLLFGLIDKEDITISIVAMILNILIFYLGVYLLSKGGRRISVYKE